MIHFNVKNSVAFVTGANRKNGIGRAIVVSLLEHGASKVYATARDASQLDDLVAEYNGKVVAVSLDVTDLNAIQELPQKYPDVTMVVNNAGYLSGASSIDDVDEVQKEILVNYIAPMAITKSFASVLNKVESSDENIKPTAVVNVNSIGSLVNFSAAGTYSASKAAAHSLTQAQRRDFKTSLVIGVYPGPIDTDLVKNLHVDKVSTSVVAQAIVDALKNGTEDVFPDPKAQQLYKDWKKDAKAMEVQMAHA